MECCYCRKPFEPDPPRRRVCPVCVGKRPAHLRERRNSQAARDAKAERERQRIREERRERQSKNLQTQGERMTALSAPPPSVSVGSKPDLDVEECA